MLELTVTDTKATVTPHKQRSVNASPPHKDGATLSAEASVCLSVCLFFLFLRLSPSLSVSVSLLGLFLQTWLRGLQVDLVSSGLLMTLLRFCSRLRCFYLWTELRTLLRSGSQSPNLPDRHEDRAGDPDQKQQEGPGPGPSRRLDSGTNCWSKTQAAQI